LPHGRHLPGFEHPQDVQPRPRLPRRGEAHGRRTGLHHARAHQGRRHRGIENDNTRYVANAGTPELRQALAEKYSGRWGRSLGPENVMVSFGAMEALTFALDVTVSPGQEVIIPDPSFPNYLGQVHRLGGVAVSVPVREDNDFKLRAEDV